MKFVDEAKIELHAGKGGDGVAAFRREKFVPKGGPSGGDGGRGGTIFIRASRDINTLLEYRYRRIFRAKNGENGQGKDCYGRSGEDLFLDVPMGTIIYDETDDSIIFDLSQDGQIEQLCKGGKGGLGNIHFKSSINRAPRQFTYGEIGESKSVRMELSVLADVGLLGFPNAGKSTLISAVSAAKPKIADYPFTTLHPHLGVVRSGFKGGFVIADIPGLIAGASDGAGLGHQFLKHLQRTKILLHVIDVGTEYPDTASITQGAHEICQELQKYDESLFKKPRWIALNKIDLIPEEEREVFFEELSAALETGLASSEKIFPISSISLSGTTELINSVMEYMSKLEETK
ncbi:GTPase ObgE [Burkholderiales bacterium]|nr:GTPase ObgE [Burkholderiales bacterium]